MDTISKLPPALIENILCLVPIQEAARTSILSKEWRYHWTKIPNVVFEEDRFEVSNYLIGGVVPDLEERVSNILSQREGMTYRCKLFYAIYQILLKHEGPIHEFTLSIHGDNTCVELDIIISYLSANYNVKKLILETGWVYVLPLSLVSFGCLTDLHLSYCNLGYESTFSVFDSLRNLFLDSVKTSKAALLRLLSSCPLLKCLTMIMNDYQNTDESTVTNLLECIPMVENLSICISAIMGFAGNGVPLVLPMPLIHLKYVYIEEMDFTYVYGLPFLLYLIRSSPNLEELKLRIGYVACDEEEVVESKECSSTLQNCSDIWLEHLNVLEILCLRNKQHELDFVKFIMAKAPVLKKVRIYLLNRVHEDDKLQVSETLLSSQCASPEVEIVVKNLV